MATSRFKGSSLSDITFLIVVPTLNSHRLLPRLVSSLHAQTWNNWRVLFVDGPSSIEHRQWLESCSSADTRFLWIKQDPSEIGIFGAMNQGFNAATDTDYLLFWGSDDWAATTTVLSELAQSLLVFLDSQLELDLCVCRGRYVDKTSGRFSRLSVFHSSGLVDLTGYKDLVSRGYIPPHQSTVFCPSIRKYLARYSSGFKLAADLDYFLRLLEKPTLLVHCEEFELVHMYAGGVSAQQIWRRLYEVFLAYRSAFGWKCFVPIVSRYLRRFKSVFSCK
jgi:glycosyltransferase involved in cell wall biosynthesis